MKRFVSRSVGIVVLIGSFACLGPTAEEKLRAELLTLTKEEAFERGKAMIADKDWDRGRKHLLYVYENFASDPISRDALLRLADSYYAEKKETSYIEALYRYRDYQSRFPNRPETDYVLMRIGDCLRKQSPAPDFDQSNTKKALQQYHELLRLYPQTHRRDEVVEKIRKCRSRLATHELYVAKFYVRRGFSESAVGRLADLLQDYPDFEATDEALFWLVRACKDSGNLDQARFFRKRLQNEFADSPWNHDAPDVPAEESSEKSGAS